MRRAVERHSSVKSSTRLILGFRPRKLEEKASDPVVNLIAITRQQSHEQSHGDRTEINGCERFRWDQGCSVSMYERDEPSITRHVNLPVA